MDIRDLEKKLEAYEERITVLEKIAAMYLAEQGYELVNDRPIGREDIFAEA